MITQHLRLPILSVVLVAVACGDAGPGASSFVKRDSSGVEIVENTLPDSAGVAWWSLEASAAVDIGGDIDDPAQALSRVAAAARLSDGRIVVLNQGSSDIRYFDATGSHLHTAGRPGQGPGEFARPSSFVVLPGDSLLVTDIVLRRTSIFTPDGRFVRALPFDPPAGQPRIYGPLMYRFADGTFLAVRTTWGSGANPSPDGLVRSDLAFMRASAAQDERTTIVTTPGEQRVVRTLSVGERGVGVSMFPSPFAKITQFGASGDRLYVATQDEPQIAVYANDGALARIIRTGHPVAPVTPDQLTAWIDDFVSVMPPELQRERRQMMLDTPAPEFLPSYGDIEIDAAGNLWVQDYFHNVLGSTPDWNVYDRDGRLIARVRMPTGLKVQQIGTDWVLSVERDDMDVEHVRLYRVRMD